MDLPLSRATAARLETRATSPSTNSELLALAADPALPSWTALLTLDQSAGRGRVDREWVTPPGTALALSVLVRDALAAPLAPWLPLLAGLALAEALDALAPGRVSIKWPNDLLLDGSKVCGILAEVVPGGRDVVIGSGLNLRQSAAQLPVATATSLAIAGVDVDEPALDRLIADYLRGLRAAVSGEDAGAQDRVRARCATIGMRVRVTLADGAVLEGVATGLAVDGRLEVATEDRGPLALAVGDVTHVRPAGIL